MKGKILKGIAGFYYVYVAGSGIYACKAKGIFRQQKIKPLVGDNVLMEVTHEGDREGSLVEILPRENVLIRPAAANVGQALIVFSLHHPEPNLQVLDRFLISMEQTGIPCRIGWNKTDTAELLDTDRLRQIYRGCGHPMTFFSVRTGEGMDEIRNYLKGNTTLLAGPSGVGKSSLTNAVQDRIHMETGEISRKLARGKNTTRHAELIRVDEDTYLFDTPGFTFFTPAELKKENLRFYYPEFEPYEGKCRFQGCVHQHEPDCAVLNAVEKGLISRERYESYLSMFEELKEEELRRWK
jgi:ribosome biogenesis GTPase